MDNINIANTNHSNPSAAVAAPHANASSEGQGGKGAKGLSDSAGSFHASIKKAYDDSNQSEERLDAEHTDNESSGNNMPISAAPAELDDRSLIKNSSVAGNAPTEGSTSAQKEILRSQLSLSLSSADDVSNLSVELNQLSSQLAIDENVSDDGEMKVLAAQINPLLKRQAGKESVTLDGLKKMASASEKIAIGSDEITTLDTEQLQLMTAKNQGLTNTAVTNTVLHNTSGQQQNLANLPASLLQTASTLVAPDAEGLAVIANTSTNSLSTINLQSMPQAEITQALGRPAWSQAMGKQVLMMVNQNIGVAEIRLNPAHLGPIEILIDMSDDQVNVSMNSRHAAVREAMEQALPKLREMLDDKGFNLADTDISKHSFAEQREQNNKDGISRGASDPLIASDVSEQVMQHVSLPAGMVDYYI